MAVATPVVMYTRYRARLVREYTQLKRLTLSPAGLHRVDAATELMMPWSGVRGIIVTDDLVAGGVNIPIAGPAGGLAQAAVSSARSGKAKAICGAGMMTPAPGAPKRSLEYRTEMLRGDRDCLNGKTAAPHLGHGVHTTVSDGRVLDLPRQAAVRESIAGYS